MYISDIERVEQLKHNEELLFKIVSYVEKMLIKNNVGYYEEIEIFKKNLGMSDEDLEYLGIRDYELEKEINFLEGVNKNEK